MSDRVIAGRYRLDRRIGAGGMGVVWQATDLELGRVVALKHSQQGDHGQIRREARIVAGLQHPHVIAVHDVVLDGEDRWLVMEYLPSRTLSAVLAEDGPLPPKRAARIGAQVADALAAMHQRGIVHRDIKPSNVLVTAEDEAKLTDFGIARWAEVTQTSSGLIGGTPGYLAPEVANGEQAGPAADVFSLGASLFTAVEGRSPWGSEEQGPFGQLRRAAGGDLEPGTRAGPLAPVLSQLLARAPADRPTALAAKGLLEELTGDHTPTTPLRVRNPKTRKRVLLGAAVVAAAALVAGLTVWLSDPADQGTMGDPRTADPCGLVDPQSFAQYGTATVNSEYGDFHMCSTLIKMPHDEHDVVDVTVELKGPPEHPVRPHTPGQIGQPDRPPLKGETCQRFVRTADGNEIKIAARHREGKRADIMCAIAETMLNGVLTQLFRGPVPRRAPFAANSIGNLRACDLLTDAEVRKAVGEPGSKPETDFGDWICYWQDREPLEADIRLIRTGEQEDGEDGRKVKIGGRDAFVEEEVADEERAGNCEIDLVHRRYFKESGSGDQWMEVALVSVADTTVGGLPMAELCARATALAEAVVKRLPNP
ncbi:protein kinase domain-containing protein [Crossiella sp. NPDC003009]